MVATPVRWVSIDKPVGPVRSRPWLRTIRRDVWGSAAAAVTLNVRRCAKTLEPRHIMT